MSKPKPIAIDLIRIDAGTQFRAATNQAKVTEYAEMFQASTEWPFDSACEVFFDGNEYYMADGFHRYLGAVSVKRSSLSCNVTNGTLRDAIKFALSANARHGLHRSNDDKRKAVGFALEDQEWRHLSSRMVADLCGVSPAFVDSLRKTTANERQSDEKRTGKDGRTTSLPKSKAKPKDEPEPSFETPGHSEAKAESEPDGWQDVDDEPEAKPEPTADTPQALQAPIQAVATQLTGMLKELKRLADHTGGEWLDISDLETQITALKYSIRQSIYWIDCMDCGGKGCKTCRQIGWLSLDRKKHLTQAQKDLVGA